MDPLVWMQLGIAALEGGARIYTAAKAAAGGREVTALDLQQARNRTNEAVDRLETAVNARTRTESNDEPNPD